MYTIELTNNSIHTSTAEASEDGYVSYTGRVASISDVSQADSKPLDRSADEVQLDRH